MPFDGTCLRSNELLTELEAVTKLIEHPQWWCKGILVNRHGQMCIVGAMRARRAEAALMPHVLHAAVTVTGRPFQTIERFNDDPKTTHAVVLQVLEQTRASLVATHMSLPPRPPFGLARCADAVRQLGRRIGARLRSAA